ncbi:MAG: 2-oxo acid dehydrogenase subunit E2 [Lewinellaceae bacterium]|nr:2-oxo acid dehydrogenase subunit E2 [Lewinellaceae bacterium]
MAKVDLIMPKMGESIMEATILKWNKQVGDTVEIDETVLEIATDKVDSEVPSPVSGKVLEILHQENDVVGIGQVIAVIATGNGEEQPLPSPAVAETPSAEQPVNGRSKPERLEAAVHEAAPAAVQSMGESGRFYSPLVRNIAKTENIGMAELEQVKGSGLHGRVTKKDILAYVERREEKPAAVQPAAPAQPAASSAPAAVSLSGNTEIVEMDRMRKLIADHMVNSKRTSAHVTSFVEADVTNLVNWRNRVKDEYQKRYGEKITFTPIFVEAVARAIRDFPMINVSVEGTKIIVKKDVNIGMAAALPTGNLIVPVIKGADQLSLAGLTKVVNDLADRARSNKLKPEEIQDGTFTLTNVGTFGNVMGTPIINQPQVAILATGAIRKKPAVVETEYGDLIAVRQMMFLSLSYDHRVVDGFLGGSFLRRVADYLEGFDAGRQM